MSVFGTEFSREMLKELRDSLTSEQRRRLRKLTCTKLGENEYEVQTSHKHDEGKGMNRFFQASDAYEARSMAIRYWLNRYYGAE